MKLHVLSDLHVDIDPYDDGLPEADLIVHAGDHSASKWDILSDPWKGRPRIYVPGNHEYYGHVWNKYDAHLEAYYAERDPALMFAGRRRVFVVDGVHFICTPLWSDIRPASRKFEISGYKDRVRRNISDFHLVSFEEESGLMRQLLPNDYEREFEINKVWISDQIDVARAAGARKIVVVTHFVPSQKLIHPQFPEDLLNGYFCVNLDRLIFSKSPDMWIFGHTHWSFDILLGNTRMVSNARGYPREECRASFNPDLVLEV